MFSKGGHPENLGGGSGTSDTPNADRANRDAALFRVSAGEHSLAEVSKVVAERLEQLELLRKFPEDADDARKLAEEHSILMLVRVGLQTGFLTLQQVQAIRLATQLTLTETKLTTSWLPEAGPYEPPPYADTPPETPVSPPEQGSLDFPLHPLAIVRWPSLPDQLVDYARDEGLRILNPADANARISVERREEIFLALRRAGIIPFALESLGNPFHGRESPTQPADVDRHRLTPEDRDYQAGLSHIGQTLGLHGTDALTYALLRGYWLRGEFQALPMFDLPHEFFIGMEHSTGLQFGGGVLPFAEASDRSLELLRALGIQANEEEQRLASIGILLAVELRGYTSYPGESGVRLSIEGDQIVATLPPPPEYIHPIVCFEAVEPAAK